MKGDIGTARFRSRLFYAVVAVPLGWLADRWLRDRIDRFVGLSGTFVR